MRSSFDHQIIIASGRYIILITDLGGGMSVECDIINVVRYISNMHRADPSEHLIIYRDQEMRWNGFDYKAQDFILLNCSTFEEAIMKYIMLEKVVANLI